MSGPVADHPHSDPGDGRQECERCGKFVWPAIHSCKGVPITAAARERIRPVTPDPTPIPAGVLEAAREAWSSAPWRSVVAVAYTAGVAAGRTTAAAALRELRDDLYRRPGCADVGDMVDELLDKIAEGKTDDRS